MREIKFRGQISKGLSNAGQWVYWGLVGTDLIDCIDMETVGQFTGLKDKNGKEIYERDLVKLATGAGLFEIVFENGCWSYISGPGSYAWGLYEHVRPGCDYLNLEVVGSR